MAEVRRLASSKIDEKMSDMEENTAEVRRVTHNKISDMEDNSAEMACNMRIATCCIKAEMKSMKVEAYECLAREREKVKHECHPRKKIKPASPIGRETPQ